jgi:hypothetical protein
MEAGIVLCGVFELHVAADLQAKEWGATQCAMCEGSMGHSLVAALLFYCAASGLS